MESAITIFLGVITLLEKGVKLWQQGVRTLDKYYLCIERQGRKGTPLGQWLFGLGYWIPVSAVLLLAAVVFWVFAPESSLFFLWWDRIVSMFCFLAALGALNLALWESLYPRQRIAE